MVMNVKMVMSGMLHHVVWWIVTYVSDMLIASIIRLIAHMIEVLSTSETLISIYQTAGYNIPEGSHLHISVCFVLYIFMQVCGLCYV
jgi:hypothetical protein